MSTTASFGAFLHWQSHYLQSPITALSGYLGMIGDPKHVGNQVEALDQARAAAGQSQFVLSSIVALHKRLSRAEQGRSSVALATVMQRVAVSTDIKLKLQRTRALPVVSLDQDAVLDGMSLLMTSLKQAMGPVSVHVDFRQHKDELILHVGLRKTKPGLSDLLKALARIEHRYPLAPGEFIPLSAAFVLLRDGGMRLVVRPVAEGRLDLYFHCQIMQQLSLVDLAADLG